MVLVVDVGNTNIVYGIYKGDELTAYWRMATDENSTSDQYGHFLTDLMSRKGIEVEDIDGIIISTVVPNVMYSFRHMCRTYFDMIPLVVGPGIKTGMNILYDNPKEVGADRIVNAIAGYKKYGGPLIIVDFGTATTFCAISETGDYLGGCISTGIKVSTDALYQHAAKLPRIQLEYPSKVICKNTVSSMQAGILYGYVGQVDYIVSRMEEELGSVAIVIATGGLSRMIAEKSSTIQHIEGLLSLDGLKIIYDMNS